MLIILMRKWFLYSIVSNTWEQATITFPARTSGALDNNNAVS
jgi:hypothetical protein